VTVVVVNSEKFCLIYADKSHYLNIADLSFAVR